MEGGAQEKKFPKSLKIDDEDDEIGENEEFNNHKKNPDPFLFTGSMVMTGSGKAVVCSVGKNTRVSRNRQLGDLLIKNESTFLEDKLEESVKQISKYAIFIASLIVIT